MSTHELPARRWDYGKARHLLNRAAFGGTPAEIEKFYSMGLTRAVDELLNSDAKPEWFEPKWVENPFDVTALRQRVRELREAEDFDGANQLNRERRREAREQVEEIRSFWLEQMLTGKTPGRDKLALFWHSHFAISTQKVREPVMVWRHVKLLREYALGNFGELVREISRDPAMVIWLDLHRSNANNPNENFARELMELFTLGEGHYTEQDIGESARAFTGYRIDWSDTSFQFAPRQHDDGVKEFFGSRGRFDGDDIINRILKERQCALFISAKLWDYYAGVQPAPEGVVEQMAWMLHRHDYELRPALRFLFTSAAFYGPEVVGGQIKSPVQWLAEAYKTLQIDEVPTPALLRGLDSMGQQLLAPPSVKGWDGNRAWITTSSLLLRYNMAGYLVNANTRPEGRRARNLRPLIRIGPDWDRVVPKEARQSPDLVVQLLGERLFAVAPPEEELGTFREFLVTRNESSVSNTTLGELAHLMMSTPRYQLT